MQFNSIPIHVQRTNHVETSESSIVPRHINFDSRHTTIIETPAEEESSFMEGVNAKVFKGCNDLHEEIDVPVVEASTYLYVYLQEVHINMTQNCSD